MKSCVFASFTVCILLFCAFSLAWAKEWKSGELISTGEWKYGAVESRLKSAHGSAGITGLVWIVPDPRDGWQELAFEIFGKDTSRYQTQIITPGPIDADGAPRSQHYIEKSASSSLADTFHTYRIEWTPDYLAFFVDGSRVRCEDDKSTYSKLLDPSQASPMEIRLTLWAGHSNWSGFLDSSNPPDRAMFDYVSYESWDNGKFTPEWKDDFSIFDGTRWKKNDQTDVFTENDFTPEQANAQGGNLVLNFSR